MDNPHKAPGTPRHRQRDSGRYRAGYIGPDGRLYRAPMTFDARDDAVAWLSARRAELQLEVRTVLAEKDYAAVRALGEEYRTRNPRSIL